MRAKVTGVFLVKLRLRSPGFPAGRRISGATVGGKAYSNFNSTEETLSFPPHSVSLAALQEIAITLS